MKKLLSLLSLAVIMVVLFTACNSNNKAETEAMARLKAYQDSVKLSADTAGLAQFQAWKAQNELTQSDMYGQTSQSQYAAAGGNTRSYSSTRGRSYSSGSGSRTSSSSGTATRKKGWSKAAKGAAIGGAAGAIGGAIINKRNRVVGGVVGGIIGAGVGYGIGRSQDKKDGRY